MTRGADSPPFFCDTQAMDTPILILAAGQSSRMRGTDKLAQIIDNAPQLHRITAAACTVSTRVYVALTAARVALIQDLPATPMILPASQEGMGGTLRAAVAALPDKLITIELVESLVPNSREISNFDLSDHLLAKNKTRALEVLKKTLDDGAEPLMLLGLIFT